MSARTDPRGGRWATGVPTATLLWLFAVDPSNTTHLPTGGAWGQGDLFGHAAQGANFRHEPGRVLPGQGKSASRRRGGQCANSAQRCSFHRSRRYRELRAEHAQASIFRLAVVATGNATFSTPDSGDAPLQGRRRLNCFARTVPNLIECFPRALHEIRCLPQILPAQSVAKYSCAIPTEREGPFIALSP